jgi:glycerophosphoryl diester phosphodiesterase
VQLLGAPAERPYDFVLAGDPRTYADLATPAGLRAVRAYAAGVGPGRDLLIPRTRDVLGAPTRLVADAHAAGLVVHQYTFRAENAFLSAGARRGGGPRARGDYAGELCRFLALGVDGFFTDQPDLGVAAAAAGPARGWAGADTSRTPTAVRRAACGSPCTTPAPATPAPPAAGASPRGAGGRAGVRAGAAA